MIIVADCRTASHGVCLHWLTYWLTEIYLPSLMFEHAKTVSTKLYFGSRPLRPVIHLVTLRHRRPRDNARSTVLYDGHRLAVLPVLRADLGDRGGYGVRSGEWLARSLRKYRSRIWWRDGSASAGSPRIVVMLTRSEAGPDWRARPRQS